MSDHLIAEANRHARALIIERDQIRTELALLREWQREVIQNANAHHAERRDAIARAERAEAGEAEQKWLKESAVKRAKELTAELAGIRALADRRNKRYHVEDTTHQLVAALDQALDIAQAELAQFRELAAERARMADLVADLKDACFTLESEKNDCDDYAMQNTAFKLMAVSNVLLQYIPNAAMKEETK